MQKEIWKDIKGFESLYQVSNLGRIKSLSKFINNNPKSKTIGFYSKEKNLKPTKSNSGYLYVVIYKKSKKYTLFIHRLVAQAFIPNPDNLPQVDHLDGNKLNNNVDNLEWVTSKENINRAWKMGLYKPRSENKGKLNNYSKSIRKKVLQYDLQGNLINSYNSTREASRITNYNNGNINNCCNNKQKTAYGFIWKYADK